MQDDETAGEHADAAATDTAGSADQGTGDAPRDAPPRLDWHDIRSTLTLGLAFVLTMILAVLFARPFLDAGLQAFEDPDNVGNSVLYLFLILAFTAAILAIARWGRQWMIQAIILFAVGSTIAYVISPLLLLAPAVGAGLAWSVGALLGLVLVVWLYVNPEWYVVDVVGLLVAAGAASIFGISLSLVPVIVLLVALAVYDAIAVYKTKHMLSLADSVIELRLPVLLVVPKHLPYRFVQETTKFKEANPENKGERDAMFMGLGDLVMPAILVVSALQFAEPGWGSAPAVGAALGTLAGFGVLMSFVLRGNPQAGLPLLNGGAILGFLVALTITTGSPVFW